MPICGSRQRNKLASVRRNCRDRRTPSTIRGPSAVLQKRRAPTDNAMLIDTLGGLKAKGNTLLVVEHDETTIAAADLVVDLGPGGGTRGGQLVAMGPPQSLATHPASLTGRFLGRARPRIGPLRDVAKNRRV